jgi:quinol-cytochrome oxidoreductase complex cytochrome b subunit
MRRMVRWIEERIPVDHEMVRKGLREPLPVHMKSWIFCLGGTPAMLFCILAVTGILLTFYYVPSPAQAYASVSNITFKVRMGWFVRGIHQGASQLMIVTVLLHMIRVFFTRAYLKPRELNWVWGVALFMVTLTFAFTGYSLVYDQLSYWATTIGTNMIAAVPLIGEPLLYLLRGGPNVNPNTLSRFYDFHIGVLPTMMTLLIVAHLALVRLHGVAPLPGDPRRETYPFFPDHMLREAIIGLLLLVCLVNYVNFFPPTVGAPATPGNTPGHIRPEWYFFPTYRWLKLTSLPVGIGGSVLFVAGLFLWPFIDAALERIAPRKGLWVIVGSAFFLLTIVFMLWEAIAG